MTNDSFQQLEAVLRARFQHVDIRSDQCDTIRMISKSLAAGCRSVNGRFSAKIVSLIADELDYKDELLAEFDESSPEKLAVQLANFF